MARSGFESRRHPSGGNMRHAKRWLRFWAKCAAATWLVHTVTGLGWLQSLAAVALFLWAGLEIVRVLARLLEAFAGVPDDDNGDDGGGPEEEPGIVIRADEEIHREAIQQVRPKRSMPGRWQN
jgi:hypothetical protein